MEKFRKLVGDITGEIFNEGSSSSDRFLFMDGWRGLMAIVVVVSHVIPTNLNGDYPLLSYFGHYAVLGFFILSSFLLSFRFLSELNRRISRQDSATCLTKLKFYICITLCYLVRRFFRIYISFVIMVFLVKYGRFFRFDQHVPESIFDYLILNYSFHNHLWSLNPEIKYYLVIPLYSLLYFTSNIVHLILIITAIVGMLVAFFYGLLDFSLDDYMAIKFKARAPVFIFGSFIASFYYLHDIKAFPVLNDTFKHPWLQTTLKVLSIAMIYLFFKFFSVPYNPNAHFLLSSIKCGSLVACFIFTLLFMKPAAESESQEFIIKRMLSKSKSLKVVGKYSFGIYLLQFFALSFTETFYSYTTLVEKLLVVGTIAFTLGVIFYYFVEKPLMTIANWLCRRIESLFNPYNMVLIQN